MHRLKKSSALFYHDRGQSLAEYGLIVALIAIVSITSLTVLGNSVTDGLNSIRSALSSAFSSGTQSQGIIAVASQPSTSTGEATTSTPTTSSSPINPDPSSSTGTTPTISPSRDSASTPTSNPLPSTDTSAPVSTTPDSGNTSTDTNPSNTSIPGFTSLNGCNNGSVCLDTGTNPWGW